MQLMFPDGDLKWTSFAGAAAAWSASARATTAASTPGCYAHKIASMARPVTLFTGQWADLPLEELAEKAGRLGLRRARARLLGRPLRGRPGARRGRLRAVDPGGARAQPPELLRARRAPRRPGRLRPDRRAAPGDPPARGLGRRRPGGRPAARGRADEGHRPRGGAGSASTQVNGFTGSAVWHLLYSFPPNDFAEIERGYEDFAERWGPIIDVFDAEGVRFGLEVHPTEIAYDFVTTRKTLDAIGNREGFGINLDPSHFAHQHLDSAQFALEFADRDLPRPRQGLEASGSTAAGRSSARTSTSARRRAAGTSSRPGHGDVDFEELFRALNRIGYAGPLSIEWEDSGMDREWGAQDALAFVRRTDFAPSAVAFDAAMQRSVSMSGIGAAPGEVAARRHPGDRRRDARLRLHGQGALERVPEDRLHDLAAAAPCRGSSRSPAATRRRSRNAAERYGYERWTTDWHDLVADPAIGLFDNGGPNSLHAEPTIAAARGGQARPLREAARPRRRRELRDLAARRRDRRQAPVRLQLPLRPGGAARARDDRRGRARRDPPLPRPLPPGLGRRPDARHLALPRRRGRLRRARRPRRARRRPRPLPRRRDRDGLGARQDVPPRPRRSTTRSRRRSSSRTARSARSRRRASRSAAATRSSGRSTARRARSPSTWSG